MVAPSLNVICPRLWFHKKIFPSSAWHPGVHRIFAWRYLLEAWPCARAARMAIQFLHEGCCKSKYNNYLRLASGCKALQFHDRDLMCQKKFPIHRESPTVVCLGHGQKRFFSHRGKQLHFLCHHAMISSADHWLKWASKVQIHLCHTSAHGTTVAVRAQQGVHESIRGLQYNCRCYRACKRADPFMDVATAGQQTWADPFMDVPLMYCAKSASSCMLLFPARGPCSWKELYAGWGGGWSAEWCALRRTC